MWNAADEKWMNDYDDLMIPVANREGEEVVVLAVPYLRSDVVVDADYSKGVGSFLRELTERARTKFPGKKIVMMAHMYAKGAEIVERDASEKILIGGMEQVDIDGWSGHPDYMTCGHIHKRQHVRNTDWARYTGSILPMSFAEINYKHGVDVINVDDNINVEFVEYIPQHRLRILPDDNSELTPKEMKKLVKKVLRDRDADGELSEDFEYLVMKVVLEKVDNDIIAELEEAVKEKDVVLCKIEKMIPSMDVSTIVDSARIVSVEEIINRDPMESLRETFVSKHGREMSEHQEALLNELINKINNRNND